MQKSLHSSDEQTRSSHPSFPSGSPSQFLPPTDGGGESHDLERVRFPTPHMTKEQFDHSPQTDQTPSTKSNVFSS